MTAKTALYARVSTQDQELESQREFILDYATTSLDVEPENIEFYTDKSTGTDTNRDGWQRLMKDVRDGDVDRLVVRSSSRITRSIPDLVQILSSLLDDHGVAVHLVKDGLDVDPESEKPMDRAMIYLTGVFADMQARMIQENTREAVAAAQAAGKHVGRPPYGFTTTDDGYLAPEPEQYALAKEALRLYDQGESKRSVCRHIESLTRPTLDRILERRDMYEGEPEAPEQ